MGSVCGKDSNKKHKNNNHSGQNNNNNLVIRAHKQRSQLNNIEDNTNREVILPSKNNIDVVNRISNDNIINLNEIENLNTRREIRIENIQNINTQRNSINEELSTRRNPLPVNNNLTLYPNRNFVESIPITLRNTLQNHNNNEEHFCNICNRTFSSSADYRRHSTNCNFLRNTSTMHNSINEILNLVQSLNRHLNNDNFFSLMGNEEPEESLEYLNWTFYNTEDGNVIWKNLGKILLSKEDLKLISDKNKHQISNEKYYKKRIWINKYINKNFYDKSGDNTTLVISRENILEESFNQFMTTYELDLRKAMHIFFVDEVAHDVGGVYREWYTSLFESIFSFDQNFFYKIEDVCLGKNSYFIPTTFHNKSNYIEYFEFIGKVLGKAIFDKITIKNNLNIILLKLILKRKLNISDLKYLDNGYYKSLKSILDTKIDENFNLYFTWEIRKGENFVEEIELIDNGKDILITEGNKLLFVEKVVNLICYESIKEKVDSLLKGFYSLIPFDIINIFSTEELDFLLSGQSVIDLEDWKKNTIYKGYYTENHPTIKLFWEILKEMQSEKLLLFYKFCTGCTKIPLDGFNALPGTRNKYQKFCVESPAIKDKRDNNRLIEAKTCFNRIFLPDYESKEKLTKVIDTIIENDTNFFGKQ